MKQRLLLLLPTTTYRAKAFLQAAQRLEIDISVASDEKSSLADLQPVALLTLDFNDPASCVQDIRRFAKEHPIHGVLGVDDQVTVAANTIAGALGLPHNPEDGIYATRNKLALREGFLRARVPSPAFRAVDLDASPDAVAAGLDYPCVVKPLMMAASRGVIRVDNAAGFADAFHRVRKLVRDRKAPRDESSRNRVLVEEYVPGWEVAVEGIVDRGRFHMFTIFDKPDPLEGPYFPETIYVSPSRMPDATQTAVEETTRAAVAALGLQHGPIHAELRGDGDRLWVIEVAARSIGGYCSKVLRFEGGLSLEDVIVRQALGMTDGRVPRAPGACGVMMLQAPRAGRFREVRGTEAATAVDGIDEFVLSAWRGQPLFPLPEGFLYLGFIFARTDTPEQAEEALRQAYAKLDFIIDSD